MIVTAIPTPTAPHSSGSAPVVSVVIPAYNRAHCITATVESALAQTFKDLEIIAVDDGSSDGTSSVLAQFGSRIRLIQQDNRGVSSARNTGVRAARGKWIAFLDSDDHWHPKKLERQIAALQKFNGKICFTRCINQQGEILRDIDFLPARPQEPQVLYVQDAVDSVCLSPRHPLVQTMVAERTFLEMAGLFDESFHAAEDAELIFRLSFFSGFLYVDQPLVTIFEGTDNSLTFSNNLDFQARRTQSYLRLMAEMYWRLADTSPEKVSVMRQRLGYFISRRAEIACAAGQSAVARTLAQDGIRLARSIRDFARCAGVLIWPGLIRSRARKKWVC
ncbi:MAG: glycosyltransferase family 2 protein [Limisphaerales bacterium]